MAGRILAVRHASTALNSGSVERVRGWSDEGLDESGVIRADALGHELVEQGVSRVFASSLKSARETAHSIAHRAGVDVHELDDLRTWHVGTMAGQPVADVMPEMQRLIQSDATVPEGGESFSEFRSRLLACMRDIMARAKASGETVAVVTHGRCLQLIKAWSEAGCGLDESIDTSAMLEDYNGSVELGGAALMLPCTDRGDAWTMDLGIADVHTPSAEWAAQEKQRRKSGDASIAIVHGSDGRVLAVRRPEPPHEFALPGGIVEDGETHEAAALREVREETGIECTGLAHVCTLESPTDGRAVHVYRASGFRGAAYPAEPHDVAWLEPKELMAQARLYAPTLSALAQRGALTSGKRTMAEISTKTRNAMPGGKFALPDKRKYPIHDAAHVRNAAARLAQAKKKGTISDADYSKARAAIVSAGKKYGIESNLSENPPKQTVEPGIARPSAGKRLHIQADLAAGGSLHVRHMSDGIDRTYYSEEPVGLADAPDGDAKAVWIQLAKSGAFAGHPAGPFELNDTVFQEIIRNFKGTQNRAIPVDYEHASEADPTSGSIPHGGAPAQGWIRDLKVEGGNLFGLVEWGNQARSQIREGQYKFISPAIRFGAKDRVTGKPIGARLTSAALTNEPFLDGMQPLAARDTGADEPQTGEKQKTAVNPAAGVGAPLEKPGQKAEPTAVQRLPAIRNALRMHPLAGARELADMLDTLRGHVASCADASGYHDGVHLAEYTNALRALVDGGATAGWERVFDAVEDMIHAAIDVHDIERHGDGPDLAMSETPPDADYAITYPDDQETNMSADDKALALKDTEIGSLKVQLKDANAKISTLEDEVKTLRAEKAKRDDADFQKDVEDAIDTYGPSRGLTDKSKPNLLRLCKADPEAFRAEYPFVPPSQRHLLKTVTPTDKREKPGMVDEQGNPLSFNACVMKLMSDKKISYADAQNEVAKMFNPSLARAR